MKRYLITGLVVWAPLGITIWVLNFLVTTLDQTLLLLPPTWHPDLLLGFHLPGLGVLLAALVLLVTGVIATNIFGAQLLRLWEGMLSRIPVVKSIYTSVKQVSDTVLTGSGQAFSKALLIEFPHAGTWTVAFLTGTPRGEVADLLQGEHMSVYVPTTPNPTSGYFVIVPRARVHELDMSVDEALKYVISMGTVAPGHRAPGRSNRAPAAARN